MLSNPILHGPRTRRRTCGAERQPAISSQTRQNGASGAPGFAARFRTCPWHQNLAGSLLATFGSGTSEAAPIDQQLWAINRWGAVRSSLVTTVTMTRVLGLAHASRRGAGRLACTTRRGQTNVADWFGYGRSKAAPCEVATHDWSTGVVGAARKASRSWRAQVCAVVCWPPVGCVPRSGNSMI